MIKGLVAQLGVEETGRERFSFHHVGTSKTFPPTDPKARVWRGAEIRDFGLDVEIDFDREVFVDYVVLAAGDPAAIRRLSLFRVPAEGSPEKVGSQAPDAETPLPVRLGAVDGDRAVVVQAGLRAKRLLLRIETAFRDLSIETIAVWGSDLDAYPVYPSPRRHSNAEGSLRLDPPVALGYADDPDGDAAFAAGLLHDLLSARGIAVSTPAGVRYTKESNTDYRPGEPTVVIRRADPRLGHSERLSAETAPIPPLWPEDYAVRVSSSRLEITGASRRALLYGAAAAGDLMRHEDGAVSVDCGVLEDFAAHPIRGMHIGLPAREDIEFFKRAIRYLAIPFRYNTIFLEFSAGMEFQRHPEIAEGWIEANRRAAAGEEPPVPHGDMVAGGGALTQAEVRTLVDYMKAHGLEVVPEVQTLSHVQYLTMSHPELAEIPYAEETTAETDLSRDDERPEGYPHCYCPKAPSVYDLVFDLIDEIIAVVRPARFVHLGHDEVYQIGTCRRCRHLSKAELFAEDVASLHEYVGTKGLRSMIWSDMLQPARGYGTEGAADLLPKDIVMLDFVWYFHLDSDLEDELIERGFTVVMGNLYSSHYPRYRSRVDKPGMAGGEVSTWCRFDEATLAGAGKLYDFMYTAEMLWSRLYDERLRWSIDRAVVSRIPQLRGRLSPSSSPSISLTPASPRVFQFLDLSESVTSNLESSLFSIGRHDLTARKSQERAVDGLTAGLNMPRRAVSVVGPRSRSDLPQVADISIEGRAGTLYFVHGLPRRHRLGEPVGRYIVRYADGGQAEIPVVDGYNVATVHRRHNEPLVNPAYRHFGYPATYAVDAAWEGWDADGGAVTWYGLPWTNPRPAVPIVELRVEADVSSEAPPLILIAVGLEQ